MGHLWNFLQGSGNTTEEREYEKHESQGWVAMQRKHAFWTQGGDCTHGLASAKGLL